MQKSFLERRRHPRLKKQLPLIIKDRDFDITTETKDISCLGAYCRVDRYIEPMTKLKIDLLLPQFIGRSASEKLVKCQGVVVRAEKSHEEGYNIAIYFNQISNAEMEKIANYVNQHLSRSNITDEVL